MSDVWPFNECQGQDKGIALIKWPDITHSGYEENPNLSKIDRKNRKN